jgi:endoglucanase
MLLMTLALAATTSLHAAQESQDLVRLSSVGYATGLAKQATVMQKADSFELVDHASGAVAFTGQVTGPYECPDSAETVYRADFTAFDTPGRYDLRLPGLGQSPISFIISEDAYNPQLALAMTGFYGWRCGTEVSLDYQGRHYHHQACHLQDGLLDYFGKPGVLRKATGGWHDAGDYNKYVVNAGVTMGCLLQAWEHFPGVLKRLPLPIPEHGGPLPDYLAELKWELDWLFTMQMPDGGVSGKLSSRQFDAFEMPEQDGSQRFLAPVGSAATADFVAVMAQASRAFAAYDPRYAQRLIKASEKGWDWLKAHPEDLQPDYSDFKTGAYKTEDPDDRLWAAVEMWEATGSAAALAEAERRIHEQSPITEEDWDWNHVKDLGLVTYALSQRGGRDADLLEQVRSGLVSAADTMVARAKSHGFGRALVSHYWGSNGTVARLAVILMSADRISHQPAYRDTVAEQLAYLYGRNHYGRSQVTGAGYKPPMHPHHRPSGSDGIEEPWPGYLVGGGTTATNWKDDQPSYATNEVAINWNAALVYALAAVSAPPKSGTPTALPTASATCTPTCTPTPPPAADPCLTERRLHCGGERLVDRLGKAWEADQAWLPGAYGYLPGGEGQVSVTGPPKSGTPDPELYYSERWGPRLAYRMYLAPGTWQVRFKMAETYFHEAGRRSMTLKLQGREVASGIDLYALAGDKDKAVDITATVQLQGQELDIEAIGDMDNATLMGLEAVRLDKPACK